MHVRAKFGDQVFFPAKNVKKHRCYTPGFRLKALKRI
jgi:hypothetical protein